MKTLGCVSGILCQFTALREKIYRKPLYLVVKKWWFPVDFPFNQSIDCEDSWSPGLITQTPSAMRGGKKRRTRWHKTDLDRWGIRNPFRCGFPYNPFPNTNIYIYTTYIYVYIYWLVVSTPLKNISQLGWLFPIYGKIKNVPNHQPEIDITLW